MRDTIRSALTARFRAAYALALIGFFIFMSPHYVQLPPSMFAWPSEDVVHAIGGVLFGIGVVWSLRIKCPRCKRGLDRSVGWALALPVISGPVNNCPYCGGAFDDPLPSAGPIE